MNMMMQNRIKEVPGLRFVAESMELMSGIGRRRMMEQPFITDTDRLRHEHQLVEETRTVLAQHGHSQAATTLRHQLMRLHDIRATLQSLRSRFLLGEVELFEVKSLAYLGGHAAEALGQLGLAHLFALPDLKPVFDILDPDGTGIPNFYIYDSYDARLSDLRKQMRQADDQLMGELVARQDEIQQEVMARLCDQLQPHADNLAEALETLAYLDFTMARATLAERWGLHTPAETDGEACLHGLFNPMLRQHNEEAGLRYQPVDITLPSGTTLVTGANMAGKTVLLKSVGVAQLMYQYGFPVPALSACMKPVDDVLFCIGDEQNEMNGLSSFASEITRISEVLRRSERERLLVLIDEPARTTNPVEGKALVQALASLMSTRDTVTLVTTHYSQLGVDCRRLRVRGFVEEMVDIPLTPDNINRFIDYSLVDDDSDEAPQEALRIAEMLQCHPDLTARARALLQKD